MRHGRRFLYGLLAVMLVAGPAQAQNTWSYDHVHQAAADPQQALTWYIEHLGVKPCDGEGNVVTRDKAERGVLGETMFMNTRRTSSECNRGRPNEAPLGRSPTRTPGS